MKTIQNSNAPDNGEARTVRDLDGTILLAERWEKIETPETSRDNARFKIPDNQTFWVKTPDGTVFEFGSGTMSKNKNKAGAMAILWHRSGGFRITDSHSVIPVKIAAMGKPSIAAYLDTVHSVDREKIGDMLDTTKGTIEQYISKVRRGHR